ncbi:SDR family NAD(P)-dependent oxidoreductase [Singulisphaera rosea]
MTQDPRERGPKPPHPSQQQEPPGLESEMDPRPDYGENSYKGSGKLEGKAAVITGGDSGIGRAVALAFAREGADVLISYQCEESDARETARAVEATGKRCVTVAGDIREESHCKAIIDRAVKEFGKIDVLVNNAAYSLVGTVEECPEAMIRHLLDTNLLGSILVIKAALPHLREQGGGRILQVSSGAGQLAFPGLPLYIASKWGIEGFIEATAQDVAPFGIEATIFEPGAIRTDFGGAAVLPPAVAAYEGTPASIMRQNVESLRDARVEVSSALGDPAKMARVMIESVDQSPAPKRVVMGSDIYDALLGVYRERAASLEAQKELAFSTDLCAIANHARLSST